MDPDDQRGPAKSLDDPVIAEPATPPESEPEKRVGWAELFFDLVFVFAVTQVSTLLEQDHSAPGLLRAFVVFVPLYWTWVGAAVRTNQRNAEDLGIRLTLFAIALASIIMTIAVPLAYSSLALVFALAYWAGRLVLGAALLHRANRPPGVPVNPFVVSMVITGPLLVVGALFEGSHPTVQLVVWLFAALLDLATPTLLRARMRGMHVNPGHLAERFGLFVLIALGESVVAIGASAHADHLDFAAFGAIAFAFVLACGLWWVYFHFAHAAVRHALDTAVVQLDITRLVLSYGHLMFIAAIITFSVGLHDAVAHPVDRLGGDGAGLLYGGTALFLAAFGFTRWAMFRLVSRTRLTAAAVVLVLLVPAAYLPALASLVLLVLVVVALNAVELRINYREGWRARTPQP